ncbi:NAD(+) diphosphatase [soil metagenome]
MPQDLIEDASQDHRPVLSRAVHDRAGLRRKDEVWLAEHWPRSRVLVVSPDFAVPVRETATGPLLQWRDPSTVDDGQRFFLGEHDGAAYGMVRGERDLSADRWLDLREVGADLGPVEAGLLVEAVGLAQWHDRHAYCPRCGQPTEMGQAGWVRRCGNGHDQFPRTDPAVIMLVHDGADRCVLGRQSVWPPGRFSILAGFVEPGESAEAAVAREVAEEVGIAVTDVRYAGSQPWPFPGSLMLGFTARVTGDPTLRIDDDEIAEAHWVSRDEIVHGTFARALPPPLSIAHRIITDWTAAGSQPVQ